MPQNTMVQNSLVQSSMVQNPMVQGPVGQNSMVQNPIAQNPQGGGMTVGTLTRNPMMAQNPLSQHAVVALNPAVVQNASMGQMPPMGSLIPGTVGQSTLVLQNNNQNPTGPRLPMGMQPDPMSSSITDRLPEPPPPPLMSAVTSEYGRHGNGKWLNIPDNFVHETCLYKRSITGACLFHSVFRTRGNTSMFSLFTTFAWAPLLFAREA